jgi:ribosomal protein S1
MIELTSTLIGKRVFFETEYYNKQLERYENITVEGIIDSLLIDKNICSYGYKVIFGNLPYMVHNNEITFIDRSKSEFNNCVGENLEQIFL